MSTKSVALALVILAGSSPAWASTIDTTGAVNDQLAVFGAPNTATYGQTFTAPDQYLTSFSLFLQNRYSGAGTLDLRGYIGVWTGTSVSNILYESATQTMNTAGTLQEFNFSPNLALTVGQQYVAFLSISDLPVQPASGFYMPTAAPDAYSDGNFVFLNNGIVYSALTTSNWSCSGCAFDAAFKASFLATTPLPAALPLFATGLGALGLLGWRSKRKQKHAA